MHSARRSRPPVSRMPAAQPVRDQPERARARDRPHRPAVRGYYAYFQKRCNDGESGWLAPLGARREQAGRRPARVTAAGFMTTNSVSGFGLQPEQLDDRFLDEAPLAFDTLGAARVAGQQDLE